MLIALLFFAFLAGFVDSVAGGGGLLQLPALFLFLPANLATNVPLLFGTNKFASVWGTSFAARQYLQRVKLDWAALVPAICGAFVFSFLGAIKVTVIPAQILKPIAFGLLVLVAIYTYARKDLGQQPKAAFSRKAAIWAGAAAGCAIGFYDGFFGPGTGTLLIFVFVRFFGVDFLHASASAKLVNVATNIAALIVFGSTSNILFRYGIPMAACNVMGSVVGSRMAILKGNRFVRRLFLCIIAALIGRLGYELVAAR
jgi:uncharacterized membrane protein YfcA